MLQLRLRLHAALLHVYLCCILWQAQGSMSACQTQTHLRTSTDLLTRPAVQAASQGRWLLLEGIDLAPPDLLASLVPLLESRQLPAQSPGTASSCHPDFQLIATVTTMPGVPIPAYNMISMRCLPSVLAGICAAAQAATFHDISCSVMSRSHSMLSAAHLAGSWAALSSPSSVLETLRSLLASVRMQDLPDADMVQVLVQRHPGIAPLASPALASLRLAQLLASPPGAAAADRCAVWPAASACYISESGLHACVRLGNLAVSSRGSW